MLSVVFILPFPSMLKSSAIQITYCLVFDVLMSLCHCAIQITFCPRLLKKKMFNYVLVPLCCWGASTGEPGYFRLDLPSCWWMSISGSRFMLGQVPITGAEIIWQQGAMVVLQRMVRSWRRCCDAGGVDVAACQDGTTHDYASDADADLVMVEMRTIMVVNYEHWRWWESAKPMIWIVKVVVWDIAGGLWSENGGVGGLWCSRVTTAETMISFCEWCWRIWTGCVLQKLHQWSELGLTEMALVAMSNWMRCVWTRILDVCLGLQCMKLSTRCWRNSGDTVIHSWAGRSKFMYFVFGK